MTRITEEEIKSGDKIMIEMAIQGNAFSDETDKNGNFVGVVKYIRWYKAIECYEIVFEPDENGVEIIKNLKDSIIYKLD